MNMSEVHSEAVKAKRLKNIGIGLLLFLIPATAILAVCGYGCLSKDKPAAGTRHVHHIEIIKPTPEMWRHIITTWNWDMYALKDAPVDSPRIGKITYSKGDSIYVETLSGLTEHQISLIYCERQPLWDYYMKRLCPLSQKK